MVLSLSVVLWLLRLEPMSSLFVKSILQPEEPIYPPDIPPFAIHFYALFAPKVLECTARHGYECLFVESMGQNIPKVHRKHLASLR